MDVDGVLSDGKIIVGDDGIELKHFNARDGFAISIGKREGIHFAIVTGRDTPGVRIRMSTQLRIDDIHCGKSSNKDEVVKEIASAQDLLPEEIIFVGDELIDAKAMRIVGLAACPADACDEIKACSDWITKTNGGEGVIREIVMLVLRAKGRYHEVISRYTN